MYSDFQTETGSISSVTLPRKLCKKMEIIIMKTQITITNSTTLNDLPDVLTVATLAAYLHTTRQNICKMLIAGEIRSVKVGRSYRVPKVFLQEFLKGSSQQPA